MVWEKIGGAVSPPRDCPSVQTDMANTDLVQSRKCDLTYSESICLRTRGSRKATLALRSTHIARAVGIGWSRRCLDVKRSRPAFACYGVFPFGVQCRLPG